MAIGRTERVLEHAIVSAAAGVLAQNQFSATTWGSNTGKFMQWEGEQFILLVKTDNAPTGTTPTVTVAIQVSEDGGAYAAPTGGAVTTTAISTATTSAIISPAAGASFMSDWVAANTHRYDMRVLVTVGNADNVVNGLSIDLLFLV